MGHNYRRIRVVDGTWKENIPAFLYDFLSELKDDFDAKAPKEVLKKLRDISEAEMIRLVKKKKN